MADATVGWEPSDLFGLGSDFHEQSSSSITSHESAMARDAQGNVQCEASGLNTTTEHQGSYHYCAASPDIEPALGGFLTTFGGIESSKVITQIAVNFSAGEYATVDVTGHNHAENAHTVQDSADMTSGTGDLIPSPAGFGVPTWAGMTLGTNSTPVSAALTCTMEHLDRMDEGGDHFVGRNLTPKAELTLEFIGLPSVIALTGWTIDSEGPSDSIDDPDSYAITAHRYIDLTP
jgi:hypothetical protein